MSAKEENDLQQLMTRFEVEVNDIAGFEQRLQQELSFLEVTIWRFCSSELLKYSNSKTQR